MNSSELKKELARLKVEKRKTLNAINSIYFCDPKTRNGNFQKLKEIDYEIKKVEFKIQFLKATGNIRRKNK